MKPYLIHSKLARLATWAVCTALCLSLLADPFAGAPTASASGAKHGPPATAAPTHPASPQSGGIGNLPRLGLEGLFIYDDNATLPEAAASGVGFIRLQLVWRLIEPVDTEPANYIWDYYDWLFSRLSANGVVPLALVLDCPIWACASSIGPLYNDRYDDFAEFVGAVAARYNQPPYNLHYYEFWNEPDGASGLDRQLGWGMHPQSYVQMLQAAHSAIKPVDPQSVLMSGGLAYDNWFHQGGPFNPEFLPGVLDNGGAQYLDAVAFHYYTNNGHGWTNIGIKTNTIRSVLSTRGVNLPLVATETGLTSSPNYGSSEAAQARYLVQMTAHGAASGLRAQTWYADKDHPNPSPGQEVFALSGLLRVDNSRKPAHTAMQVLAREVGSGTYLRQLGVDDGVVGTLEGYRFRTPNESRQVSVVWNNSPGQTTLTVPAAQAADLSGAVGMYGQALSVQPGPDGTKLLSVGPDPVYLQWNVRFSDVPSTSWMYPYVEYLASRGIISGYANGNFNPGSDATRAQFAKMVVLGMGWQVQNPSQPTFQDVPVDHTFYSYIETAFRHGIIGGYQCGTGGEPCPGSYFRPGNNITRGQIAKMVVLGKGWQPLDPPVPTFSDVPVGSPFYTYVETAAAHGIVGGYSDGTFRPGNNATRAQLSKMLALSLQQP